MYYCTPDCVAMNFLVVGFFPSRFVVIQKNSDDIFYRQFFFIIILTSRESTSVRILTYFNFCLVSFTQRRELQFVETQLQHIFRGFVSISVRSKYSEVHFGFTTRDSIHSDWTISGTVDR